jgi:ABC-type protease/lipase transport system fused ATPase/permease subunit
MASYLTINQEATGGIIIASSILVARALARSSSRSPTGRAFSAPAKAGTACRAC